MGLGKAKTHCFKLACWLSHSSLDSSMSVSSVSVWQRKPLDCLLLSPLFRWAYSPGLASRSVNPLPRSMEELLLFPDPDQ